METTTYHGWTIRRVGISWYTYAPGEPIDFKHGRHHSTREAARAHVREQLGAPAARTVFDAEYAADCQLPR